MPAYSSTGNRVVLYPGDALTVWNAESPTTGSSSQQVALTPNTSTDSSSLSVQVTFSGDPGVFEIDVQEADAPDVDGSYNLISTSAKITTVNSSFVGRLDLTGIRADFVRLNMQNDPANAVTTTATITLG